MLGWVEEVTSVAAVVTKWAAVPVTLSALWSKTPTGRCARWVWQRLVAEPADARFARRITVSVQPLIDGVKAAARQQHDRQNELLAGIGTRLDRGARIMQDHGDRLTDIETAITNPTPRDPNARDRRDD